MKIKITLVEEKPIDRMTKNEIKLVGSISKSKEDKSSSSKGRIRGRRRLVRGCVSRYVREL